MLVLVCTDISSSPLEELLWRRRWRRRIFFAGGVASLKEEKFLRRSRRRSQHRHRRHLHQHPSNPYCHCRFYSQVAAHACLHVDVERRQWSTIINDDNRQSTINNNQRQSTTINDKQRQSTNKQRHTSNDTQTKTISDVGFVIKAIRCEKRESCLMKMHRARDKSNVC